ncbi:MAG: hypothetical protein V1918_02380 [Planctomycetota bacterium]
MVRARSQAVGLVWAILLFCLGASPGAFSLDITPFGDDPPTVDGGAWHYVEQDKAVVILGRATVTKSGMTITARNMVYFTDTKEIYAEGDVVAQEPGGSLFYCDKLYYNLVERRGEADRVRVMGQDVAVKGASPTDVHSSLLGPNAGEGASWQSEKGLPYNRMFMRSNKMRALSGDHFELSHPSVTTDNSASPVFHVSSSAAQFTRNEKIESWNNVLWLGSVPVFYFPYLIKDLRYDWPWMRFAAGHTSDWGYYGLSTWGLDLNPSEESLFRLGKLFFDIDYRQDRGWAFGVDARYELGSRKGGGTIDTYWLRETNISEEDDEARAREDTEYGDTYRDAERWKIEWRHAQDLGNDWDLRAELNAYSDRDFLYEYFKRQYNEDKEPETALDLRKLTDTYVFEVFAKTRVNDFMTQAEYLPEVRLTVPSYRLGERNIFLESDTRLGFVNRKFDEKATEEDLFEDYRVTDGDEYGAFFRADQIVKIYTPLALGRFLTLTPYLGGRATYYEDLARPEEGHVRVAGLYGVELAGRFYGLYRDGNLRHIVEPGIGFVANGDPTLDPEDLYEVDEVDLYHELHYLPLKLHQTWQTRRNVRAADGGVENRVVDVVDLDLATRYLPVDSEAEDFNAGRNWTPLVVDLVWRPTDTLTFYGDLSWAMEDSYLTEANAGMDWKFRDRFRIHTTQRYQRGETAWDPELDESNQTTAAFRWLASDRYALEYALSYEWADSGDTVDHGLAKQRLTLIRNMKVLELRLSYIRDFRRDDQGFYVMLSPIGLPPIERSSPIEDPLAGQMTGRYHPAIVDDLVEEVAVP